MPAYNAARYIEESVESVLAQTYTDWELLITNDASSDKTLEIAQALAQRDPRIKVFSLAQNGGVTAARNNSIEHAAGEYIAYLDSDDLWVPDKLTKQLEFMTEHQVDVCYSAYLRIDETGTQIGHVTPPATLDYTKLLKSNFIGNLTGIYNAQRLGKRMLTTFRHEDYVAWLALVKQAGNAAGLKEPLGLYRVYGGSLSSNKLKTIGWQWRIYRQSERLGLVYSLWLMACYAWYALAKRA